VAVCSLGWMYVPDPAAAARELHRALRPGGRAIVAVWGERRHCGWAQIFPIVDARVASDVCPMFFALGAPGLLAKTLAGAGFVDVDDTRLDVDLVYADDEEALGAAFAGGPVALAWSRFDHEQRKSAADEYLASIAGFTNGTGYRVPGQFVVATGRRPVT
ncbi:MAG: class I SAM-dependent methyltransferase, partial [Ilumatobacteraceae bacterium]